MGDIRKNLESNRSIPSTMAPRPVAMSPASGSPTVPFHEPESYRPAVIALRPESSNCQKASRSAAPGKRQAMPTIAIPSTPSHPSRPPARRGPSHRVLAVGRSHPQPPGPGDGAHSARQHRRHGLPANLPRHNRCRQGRPSRDSSCPPAVVLWRGEARRGRSSQRAGPTT